MKIECTDLMNPHLVCVATISRIEGRLVEVHFDGWENDFNQWLDCCSSDIFPVGWCELIGYKLEGPITQPIQGYTKYIIKIIRYYFFLINNKYSVK